MLLCIFIYLFILLLQAAADLVEKRQGKLQDCDFMSQRVLRVSGSWRNRAVIFSSSLTLEALLQVIHANI